MQTAYPRRSCTQRASSSFVLLCGFFVVTACNGRIYSLGSGPAETQSASSGGKGSVTSFAGAGGGANGSAGAGIGGGGSTAIGGTSFDSAGSGGTAAGSAGAGIGGGGSTAIGGTSFDSAGSGGKTLGTGGSGGNTLGTGGSGGNTLGTGGSGGNPSNHAGAAGTSITPCPNMDFTATTQIVSLGVDGTPGNRESFQPALSADGRIVVFASLADNLVAGDTNGVADVFAYDRDTRKTIRVSVDSNGGQFGLPSMMPAISPEGTRVALASAAAHFGGTGSKAVIAWTSQPLDVNRFVPGLTPVSPLAAATESLNPMLANTGSLLAFQSYSTDLVAGDTNDRDDFFIYRMNSGALERFVTASDDRAFVFDFCKPRLNSAGSRLAFCGHLGSAPRNVSLLRLDTNGAEWIGKTPAGVLSASACHSPALSSAGDVVAFICDGDDLVAGDTNGVPDVFVRDLGTSKTTRVSLTPDATQSSLSSFSVGLSGDGRWVLLQWGIVPQATPETAYGGVSFHDRQCGASKTFFIATELGTIGSEMRIEEIALSEDGSTLVGKVTNVRSQTAVSQIMLVNFQWHK